MRFGILGPLEVWSAGGDTIHVGGPRPRALLVMLLLGAGRVVGVEQIVAGQYADGPPADAAGAVQAHVSRLRRNLPTDLIEFTGSGYRLRVEPEDVDAHRFERLAREGRRLLTMGQHAGAAAALREALALWRGPALTDLPNGAAPAARLDELRLAATEDLIDAELALPEGSLFGSLAAELRELVSAHPLRERLRGQLMRALHASGRQAEALAEYEEVRRLLADELGTDPSPELAATHLAILRAELPAPPGPPARQRPAAQLTSFVGREPELARLADLRSARLVTIVGPGGTGKTRLAIESAGRDRREVCFVDLSAVDGGSTTDSAADQVAVDQMALAGLGALGLRESGMLREPGFQSPTADPTRRLVGALQQESLLLVLDNCEHVVAAAATLTRTLLAECPRLAVLATSREPLGLTGETLLPLGPLDTPPPDVPEIDPHGYPAIRLFADRAAALRPGFTVGPDNAAAVIEICAGLDGLPLAIELAAARLRQFTVAEIATRLAEHGRFRLLSRGDRTASARHRTLYSVVEWSWDLLGPDEKLLARRFAVFTGGAPLAAVEAVCGPADTSADAADLLADLVDKSLVETDGGRYRMLDTIRLFCAERLAEAGEEEPVRRAHARYHLELAQRADPHLRRAEQLDWLARLSAEHANLMAALRWAVHEDRATAMRMVAALAAYWWLSGRRSQAGAIAADLLLGLPAEVPAGLAEEYVSCVVHAVPRAAPEHWSRAGKIVRTLDRPLRHPFGAALWGMAAGPPDPASPQPEWLLSPDPWNAALGRLGHGLLCVLGGRPADGEREMIDVLASFRALGERWGTAQALDWLAQVASWRGEWGRARELWAEAMTLLERLGALEEAADLLCHQAEGLVRQGDLDTAGAAYRRAAELTATAGRPGTPAEVQLGLGEIARLRGDTRDAANRLARALESTRAGDSTGDSTGDSGGDPGGDPGGDFSGDATKARILTALGRLAETSGDAAEAVRRHREALAVARTSPLAVELAAAAEGQAGAALTTGSVTGAAERAALLLGAAVALRGMAVTGDADVARIAARARDLVGVATFAEAYARGAAMTAEQALTLLDSAEG